MVVGAKVCELTDGFLWFVCGLYVGILTSTLSPLSKCKQSKIIKMKGDILYIQNEGQL